MKLEDQVCTPEQAVKLKELGAPQQSIFYYYDAIGVGLAGVVEPPLGMGEHFVADNFSAYSVAELGALLPAVAGVGPHVYYSGAGRNGGYYCKQSNGKDFGGKTEAEARAAMLIFLMEKRGYRPEYQDRTTARAFVPDPHANY